MKYLFYLLFAGAVFGLCFLVDKGTGILRRRGANAPAVRLPLRYPLAVAGLPLVALGCCVYAWANRSWLFAAAAVCFLSVAGFVVYCYRSTRIDYDEAEFTFRRGKTQKTFRFSDIDGQRVAVSRRSCCLVLCLGRDEVVLYSNMQGFHPFLEAAFTGWCRGRGLNPAEQDWHSPANHQWFPDQPEQED